MDDDDENLCRFGTALEPLEEDEIPSKKPIAIEDQIATDINGRRRFHGAFTGGFSAGFWNTVGSLEGWKPQNFKSSRTEKADTKQQKPTDFMDDEDLGEFGIAPQRVQTTEDFTPHDSQNTSSQLITRKRKLQNAPLSSGPIPGCPVLHQLLQPAKENVAIRLLKKMGWKIGQGIGARQTRKEKKVATERNARERYVMKKYGCDLGPIQVQHPAIKDASADDDDDHDDGEDSDFTDDEEITFAPDDFEPLVCGIKDNTFGLGYTGLSRNPVLKKQQQHIDLFGPFEIMGKDNKKLSIRGQAFGVGALEEEDEDIYGNDDMTKYDFSLEEYKKSAKSPKKIKSQHDFMIIEGFQASKMNTDSKKKVFTVIIPDNFKPRNWSIRKSRFEPLDDNRAALLKRHSEHKIKGLGRHDLNPDERGCILGESSKKQENEKNITREKSIETGKKKTYLERINEKYKEFESKRRDEVMNLVNSKQDNFSKGEILNAEQNDEVNILDENTRKENEKIQAEAHKITKTITETKPGVFKPFINNEAKQDRYEKFIEANLKDNEEITKFLTSIQPLDMSEWDREMEKQEFLQAKKIYKPLKGLMSDRFVSESTVLLEKEISEKSSEIKKDIEIKRTKIMWKPCSQLCKRFNIAEPFGGTMIEVKPQKKSRFSIFDYLEGSVNKKENFITPVIIPTKIEKPMPVIQQNVTEKANDNSISSRVSTKDLFTKDMEVKFTEEINIEEIKEEILPATIVTSKENENNLITPKESGKKLTKPKTDLEIKVEEMKSKHPSEKKDLFKAIFESSSEDDESEDEEKKTVTNEENSSTSNISKNILDTLRKPSAANLNILRNTSPPRGIFAYLLKGKEETPKKSTNSIENENDNNLIIKVNDSSEQKNSRKEEIVSKRSSSIENPLKLVKEDKDEGIYGPKIPTKITPPIILSSENGSSSSVVINNEEIDQKLLKVIKKSHKNKGIVEEWVEKSETVKNKKRKKKEKDKKKKSKKHKKEKKKHKDKK